MSQEEEVSSASEGQETNPVPFKTVKYSDWIGSESESGEEHFEDKDDADQKLFDQDKYEGSKGHLLLQLQKTFKGDDRFQLDKDFAIDKKQKKNLPSNLFGSLSKREEDELFKEKSTKRKEVKHD